MSPDELYVGLMHRLGKLIDDAVLESLEDAARAVNLEQDGEDGSIILPDGSHVFVSVQFHRSPS